jgi:hypothetical protein
MWNPVLRKHDMNVKGQLFVGWWRKVGGVILKGEGFGRVKNDQNTLGACMKTE